MEPMTLRLAWYRGVLAAQVLTIPEDREQNVNMSHEDNICVDYQTSTSTTQGEKCWKPMHDFTLSQRETKTFEFDAEDVESLRLRLRVDT
eukprot:scaffold459_cov78-Skeletonema_marinoi.AAC.7